MKLDKVLSLFPLHGNRSEHGVQALAADGFAQALCALLLCQMRQKICNAENRVARFLADADIHAFPVLQHNGAVQRQRQRGPLIFADAAVIMGFEKRHAALFIKGRGLEIQPRRIDMRRCQANAAFQRLGSDDKQMQALAAVIIIKFIPWLYLAAEGIGHKACSRCKLLCLQNTFMLCFALVQKAHIIAAEGVGFFCLRRRLHICCSAGGIAKALAQGALFFFCGCFAHGFFVLSRGQMPHK